MSIGGKNIIIMKNVTHTNVAMNTKYFIRVISNSS